jgi:hypothetical protein
MFRLYFLAGLVWRVSTLLSYVETQPIHHFGIGPNITQKTRCRASLFLKKPCKINMLYYIWNFYVLTIRVPERYRLN